MTRLIFKITVFLLLLSTGVMFFMFNAKSRSNIKTHVESVVSTPNSSEILADRLIVFAKTFMGTPYYYTGKSPSTGFDCSGFTAYIFNHFNIELSPASKEQVNYGYRVSLDSAKKGDLLIFTGTNSSIREPGHVGIVISDGRPVKFIHSSSVGGVKISQVDDTNYAKRFLQVRRLIN